MTASPDGTAAMFTNGLYGVYATFDGISRSVAPRSAIRARWAG
jgi:flagellar hook-associated protein 2